MGNSCKQTSDCGPQEVCGNNGECKFSDSPYEHPNPPVGGVEYEDRDVRETFVTKAAVVGGEKGADEQKLKRLSDFLEGQLSEAERERQEEAASSSLWGKILGGAGAIAGFFICGPQCAAVGAGIGSATGRFGVDILDDAESYGLTAEEIEKLDPDDIKFLKATHQEIIDNAYDAQQVLDDYDNSQWKDHVFGSIGDAWTAYQVATFAQGIGKGKTKTPEPTISAPVSEINPVTELDMGTSNLLDPAPSILETTEPSWLNKQFDPDYGNRIFGIYAPSLNKGEIKLDAPLPFPNVYDD